MANACVLMADITGSTPLYERLSQQDALNQISLMLDRMRALIEESSGHCIKSQGDDTLSVFRRADQGFAAAQAMIGDEWDHGLAVHAGLYFGEVLRHENDIYGNAVNTAARLASLAKPGEVLIGDESFDALPQDIKTDCVSLGGIKLKGKKDPTRVYSYTGGTLSKQTVQTVVFGQGGPKLGRRTVSVTLTCGDQSWELEDEQSLSIGRSVDNDITLPNAWVSRQHGKVEIRDAQMEFTDHSSAGSSVLTSDGQEYEVHRRTTMLNGEGMLLFGTTDRGQTSSILRYATNDLVPE